MLCWSLYELTQSAEALEKASEPLWGAVLVAVRQAASAGAMQPAKPPRALIPPLHSLSTSPPALQLRAEADAVYGKSSGKNGGKNGGSNGGAAAARDAVPPREAVDGMEWTLSVLKEALRKYSVVPVVTRNLNTVSRVAGGASWLAGWLLPLARQLSRSLPLRRLLQTSSTPRSLPSLSNRTTSCWGTASPRAPGSSCTCRQAPPLLPLLPALAALHSLCRPGAHSACASDEGQSTALRHILLSSPLLSSPAGHPPPVSGAPRLPPVPLHAGRRVRRVPGRRAAVHGALRMLGLLGTPRLPCAC